MKIIVDTKKCLGSGECYKVCPHDAIRIVDKVAVIDHARCDLDGLCIPACPHDAIGLSEDK